MTSDWCYKCPRCGEIIELEGEEIDHGDGDVTNLQCWNCGQAVKCMASVAISYYFYVEADSKEFNIGVENVYVGGSRSDSSSYNPLLEDADEWDEIHRILTGQEEDEE